MLGSTHKTNKYWYPYRELGSYFRLENGGLMQSAMNADGSRDDTSYAVFFDRDSTVFELIDEDLRRKE